MRKPAFCICENKDADQLRGNRKADQRVCFRYTDSTIPLHVLPKSEISSVQPSSVAHLIVDIQWFHHVYSECSDQTRQMPRLKSKLSLCRCLSTIKNTLPIRPSH